MRKLMMGAVAFVLAGGTAGAQVWPTENGQFKLTECYGTKEGVQCDLMYTLVKSQTFNLDLYGNRINAFMADGTKVSSEISIAGGNWSAYPSAVKVYNGTPVKVSLYFNIPANTTTLAALAIGDENVQRIPVRPLGVPAAVPAPVTAASAQAINIAGNWNASLTNCKQINKNEVACIAILRK